MRKSVMLVALVVLIALLSLTLVVLAQDGDAPNLCTDGTWYCPDPDDAYREAWNWACGAYFAQLEAEMIKAVPEWCEGPPPPPPAPLPTPTLPPVF